MLTTLQKIHILEKFKQQGIIKSYKLKKLITGRNTDAAKKHKETIYRRTRESV